MQIHNFKDSKKLGDKGEAIVYQFMLNHPKIESVMDVRDDRNYQKIDVDYQVRMANGTELGVEVKTDSYKSGNIFYETVSAEEVASRGCLDKTQADYLFYYFINLDRLYILNMSAYRNFVQYYQSYFDTQGFRKELKNYRANNADTYTSIGYAIPLSFLHSHANNNWMNIYRLQRDYSVAS
ncbi:hypothetical protein [Tetragenococcus halophilus]|uniref:hypothetical protein n=1 Tax=Tetragenococcus halophilus TaxID=51669 RepID=UPI00301018BC